MGVQPENKELQNATACLWTCN